MIKPRAFSHSGLRISNLGRSRDFYEKVLNLKPIARPNFPFDGAWYGIGSNAIHLICSENRGHKIDPLGPHLAIEVEDFEATKAALKELGIEFLEAPSMVAGRQLWVLDPDGNTIELRTEK
jgi:glyoxylase I family protein